MSNAINAIASWASILGLVLTGFAYWEARKAKQAAEKARRQAEAAMARLQAVQWLGYCHQGTNLLAELQSALDADNWTKAGDRAILLAPKLASLVRCPLIEGDALRDLRRHYDSLDLFTAELSSTDGMTKDEKRKFSKVLTRMAGLIVSIQATIEESFYRIPEE